MLVTNNFEKEFFCVPNGKVQHLILYMFFSFWGLKGVGEREFSLFLMCSHQSS
jgi:hypothetical protein